MTDVLDLSACTSADLEQLYRLTDRLKADPAEFTEACHERTLLLLFAEPSTRTRLSFQVGIQQLGGEGIHFAEEQSQLSRGEPIRDTAAVVSRYVDSVAVRLPDHGDLETFADHADVPVINALTDRFHPCQALADCYTLHERGIDGPVAFVGDGNNVAQSLMQACDVLGIECRVATPPQYEPDPFVRERTGPNVRVLNDPDEAVEGAAAVYTDVFVSMHHEDRQQRLADFEGFQVTTDRMDRAADDAVFMHCLPAHRGEEVEAAVIDGPQSVVYDQAENRLHVQKALLATLL